MTTQTVNEMQPGTQPLSPPRRFPAPSSSPYVEQALQLSRASLTAQHLAHAIQHYSDLGAGVGKAFEKLTPIEVAELKVLADRFVAGCRASALVQAESDAQIALADYVHLACQAQRAKYAVASTAPKTAVEIASYAIERELMKPNVMAGIVSAFFSRLKLPKVTTWPMAIVVDGQAVKLGEGPHGIFWADAAVPACVCGELLTEDHETDSHPAIVRMQGVAPAVICNHCGCCYEIGPLQMVERVR